MIIEYTYDNRKICNGCSFLNLDVDDRMVGTCECKESRVKDRRRLVTDRKCKHKILVPGFYKTAEVPDV